jgi:riboflavin transporter FmnP
MRNILFGLIIGIVLTALFQIDLVQSNLIVGFIVSVVTIAVVAWVLNRFVKPQ